MGTFLHFGASHVSQPFDRKYFIVPNPEISLDLKFLNSVR